MLLTNKPTNKQTKAAKNVTSLAEVNITAYIANEIPHTSYLIPIYVLDIVSYIKTSPNYKLTFFLIV